MSDSNPVLMYRRDARTTTLQEHFWVRVSRVQWESLDFFYFAGGIVAGGVVAGGIVAGGVAAGGLVAGG